MAVGAIYNPANFLELNFGFFNGVKISGRNDNTPYIIGIDSTTSLIQLVNTLTGMISQEFITIGPTGPTGPGITRFAYFWQSVTDVAATIAANNGKALFQTASSNNSAGITTVAASGDITIGVGAGGIYKITQFVAGAEPNAFAVFINGAVAAGTIYGSGAGTQQNGGFSLLTLVEGDVVSLRTRNCAAAITLQLAGTTDVNQIVCSILLERIAS